MAPITHSPLRLLPGSFRSWQVLLFCLFCALAAIGIFTSGMVVIEMIITVRSFTRRTGVGVGSVIQILSPVRTVVCILRPVEMGRLWP